MRKGKIVLWSVVGLVGLLILTWGTLVINDYNRVLRDYKTPIFATTVSKAADGNSGVYQGLGYRIELSGRFRPDSDPAKVTVIDGKGVVLNPYPNVLQADFYLFGRLSGHLDREDPYI
ncbi:MAG: hypothetical protein RR387_04110 [Clostridiales bacterium]